MRNKILQTVIHPWYELCPVGTTGTFAFGVGKKIWKILVHIEELWYLIRGRLDVNTLSWKSNKGQDWFKYTWNQKYVVHEAKFFQVSTYFLNPCSESSVPKIVHKAKIFSSKYFVYEPIPFPGFLWHFLNFRVYNLHLICQ